ncbi:MAG: hypothetical protein N0E55_00175, partial [Candidatus Thiodiazotropha taylori]|nr:hypothetical protein [Candidatus Thiodiazotropha taylori]MCW4251096.1 hypothetical protein [Candidatus Thiodiazotropha taylori]
RFRFGPSGALLGEYDQTGQAIREYVYLEGQPVAQLQGPVPVQVSYLHTDHLGAVVKATDGTGSVVWDSDRKPFGERSVTVAQVEMPLGFPGQYYDQETGNYYNYFRDYDPATGGYLQSDPIGLEGGFNTYSYAYQNPNLYIDPTGEFGVVGAVFGSVLDIAMQMAMNGGRFECIDWNDVAIAGVAGAMGGAWFKGAYKLSKGSSKWNNVRRRYRRGHNVPRSHDVHHWGISRRGPIGRRLPDGVVNHPANLNPIPRGVHRNVHGNGPTPYNAVGRWWHGTPEWAKAAEVGVAASMILPGNDECECKD